ncbi:Uncharacterised protein [Mycobacteroides abscessus subsp. abscessus]|nr:Uncharacterised protein [Mycobacteroides abscessus subsp. abscessus]
MASTSSPRSCQINAIDSAMLASNPPPAATARVPSDSASRMSVSWMAADVAAFSTAGSGARSEPRASTARRTRSRGSVAGRAVSAAAIWPCSRRIRTEPVRRTSPSIGWDNRTEVGAVLRSTRIRPSDSASATAPGSVTAARMSVSSGSVTASASSTSRAASGIWPILVVSSSARVGVSRGWPAQSHTPECRVSRPALTSVSNRWRRYSTLPCVYCHSCCTHRECTGPPRMCSTSFPISGSESGCSSMRSSTSSFQMEVMASGAGSPDRTVSTTVASRRVTSWCTANADRSSSRWASSTPTTTLPFGAVPITPSITSRTRRSGSGPKSLTTSANAPSGMVRADAVPAIHRERPGGRHTATASRARRVFPTPASPANTMPRARSAPRRVAPAITRSSSARPCRGHSWSTDRSPPGHSKLTPFASDAARLAGAKQ